MALKPPPINDNTLPKLWVEWIVALCAYIAALEARIAELEDE